MFQADMYFSMQLVMQAVSPLDSDEPGVGTQDVKQLPWSFWRRGKKKDFMLVHGTQRERERDREDWAGRTSISVRALATCASVWICCITARLTEAESSAIVNRLLGV